MECVVVRSYFPSNMHDIPWYQVELCNMRACAHVCTPNNSVYTSVSARVSAPRPPPGPHCVDVIDKAHIDIGLPGSRARIVMI